MCVVFCEKKVKEKYYDNGCQHLSDVYTAHLFKNTSYIIRQACGIYISGWLQKR